jgi:hypothetical protein
MSLTLTCKTATDLLANISRRTTGLTRCDLSNSSELDDRAVIILAANCGLSLWYALW